MNLEDMEDLLIRLGIEPTASRGDEIQAKCPGHFDKTGKFDKNPSWYINARTGFHICFSCQFKGSLAFLIAYINKYYDDAGTLDFDRAKEWAKESSSLSDLFDKATTKRQEEDPIKIDPAMLAAFDTPPAYALRSRGLSAAAAEACRLLWEDRTQSWIIPIHSGYSGSLLGWQQKAYQGRYFSNYPAGMKKSDSLFGYTPSYEGTTLLVESPLDAVRLHSLGLYGVASYGSYISKRQINLIKSSSKLILALDNDTAGVEATNRILKMLPEMQFEAWIFNYSQTDQKDIGGMSRDEILYGIDNARHFVALLQGA